MLKSRGKDSTANSKKRDEVTYELLDDGVTVYITSHGTEYVLPVDLLFSPKERVELLKRAEQRAAGSKSKGEERRASSLAH